MTDKLADVLKPCPFCGSEAKQYGTNVIGCTETIKCGASVDFGHYTGKPEPLIAAWNTRHEAAKAATPDDVREALLALWKSKSVTKVPMATDRVGYFLTEEQGKKIEAALRQGVTLPREVVDALEIANKVRLYNGQYMSEVFPEIGKALAILDQHMKDNS